MCEVFIIYPRSSFKFITTNYKLIYIQAQYSYNTLMAIKKKTLKVHYLNLRHSRMIYAYRMEDAFDPLDFYVPTGFAVHI